MNRFQLAAIAAALSSIAAAPALAARFDIGPGHGESSVKFHSKAPVESFEGKTGSVSGLVTLDPASLGESIEIEVTVDMASLDTGIGLRNRHMRENHLHTDEFPHATFRGGRLAKGAGASLAGGGAREIVLAGEMTLHGVTREIEVPLEIAYHGSELRIRGEFHVALSDYDIPRPRFLVMKLGDVQKVTIDLLARPAAGGAASR